MANAEMARAFVESGGEKPQSKLARHVRTALRNRHRTSMSKLPEWCYFEELAIGSAWRGNRSLRKEVAARSDGYEFDITEAGQRIDGFAIARYESAKARRIAYEIKVSRGDFLAEMKDPDKRVAALRVSNEFYFVAPKGLIQPQEIPAECGLIEVDDQGRTRIRVKAPWRDAEITAALLLAVARKVAA
jgi:hypothetical protein